MLGCADDANQAGLTFSYADKVVPAIKGRRHPPDTRGSNGANS